MEADVRDGSCDVFSTCLMHSIDTQRCRHHRTHISHIRKQMLEQERWERTDVPYIERRRYFKIGRSWKQCNSKGSDVFSNLAFFVGHLQRYLCNTRSSWTTCWVMMQSEPCWFAASKFLIHFLSR